MTPLAKGRTAPYRGSDAFCTTRREPGYHHVWCRGNNKRPIVVDARDRRTLLEQTDTVARRFGWKVLAYCLMDNHYHLVIEIDERGMSRGFCRLNTGYATTSTSVMDA